MAAGVIIIALTITVIMQAVELSEHAARVPSTAAIQWGTDGAIADFPLKGTRGAFLQTQYLRFGHGSRIAWLTLAAAGLPRGWDYTAWVGDCRRGRPHRLTGYMAVPDNQTGIWLASWPKVPDTPDTIRWITVTRAGQARPLGGIRGNFVFRGRLVAIPPGHAPCP